MNNYKSRLKKIEDRISPKLSIADRLEAAISGKNDPNYRRPPDPLDSLSDSELLEMKKLGGTMGLSARLTLAIRMKRSESLVEKAIEIKITE